MSFSINLLFIVMVTCKFPFHELPDVFYRVQVLHLRNEPILQRSDVLIFEAGIYVCDILVYGVMVMGIG